MNDPDYFLEIESHFATKRGTPFIFSAKDWALMKSWYDEGVPLSVVIEAIDRCFEKRGESKRRGTISSLTYCKHAVIELWAERKDLLVGAEGAVPETDSSGILLRLADALEAATVEGAVRERIAAAAGELRALSARAASVNELEESLITLEESLLKDIVALMDDAARRELETEVDRLLASFDRLDDATRHRTREANFKRIIRSRFGIPRLSLFA